MTQIDTTKLVQKGKLLFPLICGEISKKGTLFYNKKRKYFVVEKSK
jgi:hypothetical protein